MNYPVDEFFNEDNAEPLTYTPVAGSARSILGIFDNENSPSQMGNVTVINESPTVDFKTSDIPDVTINATVERGTTTYYVKDPGLDDCGITTLELSKNRVDN